MSLAPETCLWAPPPPHSTHRGQLTATARFTGTELQSAPTQKHETKAGRGALLHQTHEKKKRKGKKTIKVKITNHEVGCIAVL